MSRGRRVIICSSCNKEKLHFGLQMCSACLRNYKRKTKPSFYLGTCYSEISRRCKTYDDKRPKYFGKSKCTKGEFINRFLTDEMFLNQFKIWQDNNYTRKFAPSIDRIDNDLDYTLDNIRFIAHNENSKKDIQNTTFINDKEFCSQKEAAEYLGINASTLCVLFKENGDEFIYNNARIKRNA